MTLRASAGILIAATLCGSAFAQRTGGQPVRAGGRPKPAYDFLRVGLSNPVDDSVTLGWHGDRTIIADWIPRTDGVAKGLYVLTLTPSQTTPAAWQSSPFLVGSGPISFAATKVSLSNHLPPAPTYGLNPLVAGGGSLDMFGLQGASALRFATPRTINLRGLRTTRQGRPVIRPVKSSTVVSQDVLREHIFSSGAVTVYMRVIGLDEAGNPKTSSNTVAILLREEAISQAMSTMASIETSSQSQIDGQVYEAQYGQTVTTNATKIKVRYTTSSKTYDKLVLQASATPFPKTWYTFNAPEHNLIRVPLPKVTAPQKNISEVDLSKLLKPISATPQKLYLRVLALNPNGTLAAIPSGTLAYVGVQTNLEVKPLPATPPPAPHMSFTTQVKYAPPRVMTSADEGRLVLVKDISSTDPQYPIVQMLANAPATGPTVNGKKTFLAGSKLYLTPGSGKKDDSVWDSIVKFVSAVYDFIAAVVNWVSQAYADLQAGIVSFVASATGLPPSVVAFGLACALSALGLPPTLPNMDQLMDQGLDYLAQEAVSAAGVPGVAQDLTKDLLKDGIREMAKELKKTAPPGYIWKHDPDFGDKPAIMTIVVTAKWVGENPPTQAVGTGPIEIRGQANIKQDGSSLGLPEFSSHTIFNRSISIPPMKNGQSLTIPVCITTTDPFYLNAANSQNAVVDWWVGGLNKKVPYQQAW